MNDPAVLEAKFEEFYQKFVSGWPDLEEPKASVRSIVELAYWKGVNDGQEELLERPR